MVEKERFLENLAVLSDWLSMPKYGPVPRVQDLRAEAFIKLTSTFGAGEVGQRVKAWIDEGVKCETKTGKQISCGNPAKVSVDFEMPLLFNNQLPESQLACLSHIWGAWTSISNDMLARGRTPNLTINGHGRP